MERKGLHPEAWKTSARVCAGPTESQCWKPKSLYGEQENAAQSTGTQVPQGNISHSCTSHRLELGHKESTGSFSPEKQPEQSSSKDNLLKLFSPVLLLYHFDKPPYLSKNQVSPEWGRLSSAGRLPLKLTVTQFTTTHTQTVICLDSSSPRSLLSSPTNVCHETHWMNLLFSFHIDIHPNAFLGKYETYPSILN